MSDRFEDRSLRRMHPKLRVLANSNARVNAAKAEVQGCLKVTPALAKQVPLLATAASPGEVSNLKTAVKDLDTVDRRENVEVNVSSIDRAVEARAPRSGSRPARSHAARA